MLESTKNLNKKDVIVVGAVVFFFVLIYMLSRALRSTGSVCERETQLPAVSETPSETKAKTQVESEKQTTTRKAGQFKKKLNQELFDELIPQYDAGQMSVKEMAESLNVSDRHIRRLISKRKEDESNDQKANS